MTITSNLLFITSKGQIAKLSKDFRSMLGRIGMVLLRFFASFSTTSKQRRDLGRRICRENDLQKFTVKFKESHIRDLYDFHSQRKFTHIGGWLRQKSKITEEGYLRYFWHGIPKTTPKKLEERMLQANPTLDRSPLQTIEAAEHIFDISRFYDDDDNSEGSDKEDPAFGQLICLNPCSGQAL
jgi:hypothetical protein